jgi:1,4-dihydroxy-2-naphthoate octaprenyltransferase
MLSLTPFAALSTDASQTASTRPSPLQVWLMAARPKTLGAAIAPVLLGTAMAYEASALHWPAALCALLGAVLIQVGVNYHNDYTDFVKGTDTEDRVGPTRVTQAGYVAPETMRRATIVVFALAVLAGVYLIVRGGWPVLLIGVLSIASAVLYTAGPYSLADTGLADLFVLIFFGPVAVGGTFYVQALTITWPVIVAGLGPGLLSEGILLVNNIRDLEGDRAAGKRTVPVRLGRRVGVMLYGACVIGAALVPVVLYALLGAHPWVLMAVPVVLLAAAPMRTLWRERRPERLNPLLAATGRVLMLYSVVFAWGWMV